MTAALKELYSGQAVENLVYRDNPFLAMLKKQDDFGGKYYPVPIVTGVSQGRSSVFATAQTNESAPEVEAFQVTRAKDYGIGRIDRETMLASATDKMSFIKGAKFAVDSALKSVTMSLASALFRSGTGTIGKISTISTGVITLDDPTTVTQFERNMVLQAAQTDGGTLEAGLGYVIAVNRAAGTLTVSASAGGAAGTPSGWSAGDFLLVEGDKNVKVKGLAAWLPTTAPTGGDNFFGVDRSVDPTRLAGVRYDGSSQSIEEALIDASSLLAREGGMPSVAIMSFASYSALEKALGAKAQYVNMNITASIGFRGIAINGANSQIQVFADRNQVGRTCHLLDMGSWELMSLKPAPHIFDYDGDASPMLRVGTADAGEVRVGYYANLVCNAPGWNATVALGA